MKLQAVRPAGSSKQTKVPDRAGLTPQLSAIGSTRKRPQRPDASPRLGGDGGSKAVRVDDLDANPVGVPPKVDLEGPVSRRASVAHGVGDGLRHE